MPSIGNGHLAANVFSDTVYMNGLYNGHKGHSHRARIPNWANIRLNSTLTESSVKPIYSLDTKDGVFRVRVDRERSVVTQRIYAHRYYTRTIVNQIEIVSKIHFGKLFSELFYLETIISIILQICNIIREISLALRIKFKLFIQIKFTLVISWFHGY